VRKMWKGKINLKEGTEEEVRKICGDISAKDKSFQWEIKGQALFLTHENKDILWKKLLWMVNKVKALEGQNFSVKRDGQYKTKNVSSELYFEKGIE